MKLNAFPQIIFQLLGNSIEKVQLKSIHLLATLFLGRLFVSNFIPSLRNASIIKSHFV